MVGEFLHATPLNPHHASFGVAGPSMNGPVTLTNLPWVLDERDVAAQLAITAPPHTRGFQRALAAALLQDLPALLDAATAHERRTVIISLCDISSIYAG